MSKTIDLSKGLEAVSDDDLLYLAQRDHPGTDEELAARGLNIDGSKQTPLDQLPNTGNANTAGDTIESLEAKLAQMRAEQAVDEDDEDRLGPDDYADATNDDLRTEIVRRNEDRPDDDQLSLGGKKADLIAELERSDAESDDDE